MKLLIFIITMSFFYPSFAKGTKDIKIAMSAAFVSESGINVYKEITNYVSKKLGSKASFVTGLDYETINDMLRVGAVDVGFVCGLPYVLLKDEKNPKIELIAAPIMKNPRYEGKPQYYSDIIVRKDFKFKKVSDLKGLTFVYNEEISNSGYNMPRAFFIKNKLIGKNFFGKVQRSGSHEESIRMVANGQADYSFVDSLVLEYDIHLGKKEASMVKVVESIGPAGIPPVILSKSTPKHVKDKIKDILISMHKDKQGREILDSALVEKFVTVSDANYKSIRDMYDLAKSSRKQEIK